MMIKLWKTKTQRILEKLDVLQDRLERLEFIVHNPGNWEERNVKHEALKSLEGSIERLKKQVNHLYYDKQNE